MEQEMSAINGDLGASEIVTVDDGALGDPQENKDKLLFSANIGSWLNGLYSAIYTPSKQLGHAPLSTQDRVSKTFLWAASKLTDPICGCNSYHKIVDAYERGIHLYSDIPLKTSDISFRYPLHFDNAAKGLLLM